MLTYSSTLYSETRNLPSGVVSAARCPTVRKSTGAPLSTLPLLLVMPQSVPQCRLAAIWRELDLAHDIGDPVLQLEGAHFQQREIVLTLL
jgi:hypothetical protein